MSVVLSPAAWGNPALAAAQAYTQEEYNRVVQLLPTSQTAPPEARLLRARALIALKQFDQARRCLKGLLQDLPHLRDLIRYLEGETYFGLKQYNLAAKKFRDAARAKDSKWVYTSWHRRADAFFAAKNYTLAAQGYLHLLRVQKNLADRPTLKLKRALCQRRLGQRHAAAIAFQEIWLTWPSSPAAAHAQKELTALRSSGIRIKPPSFALRLGRFLLLRKEKRYAAAQAELDQLSTDYRAVPAHAARLRFEQAQLFYQTNQLKKAISLLLSLPEGKKAYPPAWLKRRLLADWYARVGRLEDGVNLLLKGTLRPRQRLQPAQKESVRRAARLLAEYGRYADALAQYTRVSNPRSTSQKLKKKLAWLSYRSGMYERAIQGLASWHKRAPGEKGFTLYWQGRAYAKAGQLTKAYSHYRQLVEKLPYTYYGLLARSRLVEAEQMIVSTTSSCARGSTAPHTDHEPELLPRLNALITRHGDLFPTLQRVRTFWELGMKEDARRELRLVAIEASWLLARSRLRSYIQRPDIERFWRDGPIPPRRWNRRARAIRQEGIALRHDFGNLMTAASLSYFGWQLGPPDSHPLRRQYPRAFPELVLEMAQRFQLDPHLIWSIMRTESHYRLDVISRAGARGLMQIMPTTGRLIADELKLTNFNTQQLFNARMNLLMGSWYLSALWKKFKGQIPLVAAGYNGGPHNVARWLDQRGRFTELDEFIEEIPYRESKRYAKKILRLMALHERIYCKRDDRLISNTLDTRYDAFPHF